MSYPDGSYRTNIIGTDNVITAAVENKVERVVFLSTDKGADLGETMGLSHTSVQGYLPHSKIIYSLDTLSIEAERRRMYRFRQKAMQALHDHIDLPDESLYLWNTVIAFEGFVFSTSGRGKEKKGATRFRYVVSSRTGSNGKHYGGERVDDFGNEIMGEGKEKSISRFTGDLALRRAVKMGGKVKGSKALELPGSGSYLYPILIRFGVIAPTQASTSTANENESSTPTVTTTVEYGSV